MAFGLLVITRSVGGLTDFFKNEEHGFISDSLDPKIFADLIEKLFMGKNLYEKKMPLYNYHYT
jgi:glycosyltransferase involved in cell wall biosynthesis